MKETIIAKLNEIEKRENFEILFACESGSRAWGFASDDSDYDVRFVYVRNVKDYLIINPLCDVCDGELNKTYDINGWDLKKFFALLLKSNPAIFEWTNSSMIYKTSDKWGKIIEILPEYFNAKKLAHHYFSMALKNYEKFLQDENVECKKYLYVIRGLLSCKWVVERQSPVPLEFPRLCEACLLPSMRSFVYELLEIKQKTSEAQNIKRIKELDKFIQNCFVSMKKAMVDTPKHKNKRDDELDKIFADLVLEK